MEVLPYTVSLDSVHLPPHLFMNLDKFIAGRLHQMKAGKSYLLSQPLWNIHHSSPICSKCEKDDETLKHLFTCLVLQESCTIILSTVQEDPFWDRSEHINKIAQFIHLYKINYPPICIQLLTFLLHSGSGSLTISMFMSISGHPPLL